VELVLGSLAVLGGSPVSVGIGSKLKVKCETGTEEGVLLGPTRVPEPPEKSKLAEKTAFLRHWQECKHFGDALLVAIESSTQLIQASDTPVSSPQR
jgi:hypothetical protein